MLLSNHLILSCHLLLLPSVFPSIRVFPVSQLHIKWPEYWSSGISPSSEYSELISSISLHCSFKKVFLSLLAILWKCSFGYISAFLSIYINTLILREILSIASWGGRIEISSTFNSPGSFENHSEQNRGPFIHILFEEVLFSAEEQNKRQQFSPGKYWDAWNSALMDISQKH